MMAYLYEYSDMVEEEVRVIELPEIPGDIEVEMVVEAPDGSVLVRWAPDWDDPAYMQKVVDEAQGLLIEAAKAILGMARSCLPSTL